MKVVYIEGYTRSGTTLLDRLLGEAPGFVSGGEIRMLWDRGLVQDHLCGCGSRFSCCPFWRSVLLEAFGGVQCIDAARMLWLSREMEKPLNMAMLMVPVIRSRRHTELMAEWTHALAQLYRAIATVSGCEVVVDSSKGIQYLLALTETPGIDVGVVHLTRDSRAVAYSWRRRRRFSEVHCEAQDMPRYGSLETAAKWAACEAAASLLQRVDRIRVRYEDVARSPLEAARSIAYWAQRGSGGPEEWTGRGQCDVSLGASHTVSGNPMRFKSGVVHVALDVEYRKAMRAADYWGVTALTWPLLLRCGYPLRRGTLALTGRPSAHDILSVPTGTGPTAGC